MKEKENQNQKICYVLSDKHNQVSQQIRNGLFSIHHDKKTEPKRQTVANTSVQIRQIAAITF